MPKKSPRSPPDSPPDYGTISIEHFGTPAFGDRLASLARVAARYRDGAGLTGPLSRQRREAWLEFVGRGEAAARAFEQVDLAALMDAYGEPIPGENRAGWHRQAAYQGVLSTHAALERMSQRLAARAQQAPPRGGGRPRVTEALNFALEGLLAIWEAAGRDTATGEQGSRAFSGLALELLTAPPLGFSRRSVERRITALLRPSTQTLPVADLSKTKRTRRAHTAHVLIVGPADDIAAELAASYAADGAKVVLAIPTWPDQRPKSLPHDKKFAFTLRTFNWNAKEAFAVISPTDPLDLLIITEAAPQPAASGPAPDIWTLDQLTEERAIGIALIPLHELVRGARQALRKGQHPRVVLLMAAPSNGADDPDFVGLGQLLRDAARRQLVAAWNAGLHADGGLAVAITPGWGRAPDGRQMRYTAAATTARTLCATVAGLRDQQAGCLLDLHGNILPR